jgi:NAD(P)-dependent dehydrogenase (short-subunit alcohol dehydrogenase family)
MGAYVKTISDQVVLLTGATSGIGRDLALLLKDEGARLALCGRSGEKMADLLNELGGPSEMTLFHRTFCLSSEAEIVRFVADADGHLGPVDVLINCAGINSARGTVAEISISDLDWMLAINLRAPLIFMRECFKRMRERRSGHVVNVLSTVCLFSNEGIGAYTASKAGLDALTKVFRKEARDYGVRVTSVYPGGVNTTFRAQRREDYMTPRSVAEAIVGTLKLEGDAAVHEIVLRPLAESNFC